ncbi:hypothetical protein [Streptomyces sp. NBC_00252]|uniref:hypothetical protein n=1 Tax=Streptomyces sp. NBC_00252 TaxID=2975691 RepID=UPI003FA72F09
MRARDLAVEYESVSVDGNGLDAARLMAEHKLPGPLVLDTCGEPMAILPASQMREVPVPVYVIEDPTLGAVVDEQHADRLCQALAGCRVGDCLSKTGPRRRSPTRTTPPGRSPR